MTLFPEIRWRPLYRWTDPVAEALHASLEEQADEAARLARLPYEKTQEELRHKYQVPA